MIVTEIKEKGFLTVTSIGGMDTRILQASEVIIYGEGKEIYGVVGSTPPHLQKPGESGKLRDITELLIDTGYSKEELEKYVSIGTPVGFRPVYTKLRNNKIAGKGFDDKACAACAIAAVAEIPAEELWGDVYVQLSNFEESGAHMAGAQTGAYEINPVCAIVADVDLGATPDTKKSETVPLDGGPSLSTGPITDKRLTKLLRRLADEKEIKHQMTITSGGTGTNTMVVNLVRNGIPTVDMGLPLRSMHTSNEVISMNDAAAMRDLIALFVTSPEIAKEVCPNE
jgi:endoglucanase